MSRVSQARNPGKYFLLIDNMLVVLGFSSSSRSSLFVLSIKWGGLP